MSIEGQGHYLTLAQGRVHTKILTRFSQKLLGHSELNFVWKLSGTRKWKFVNMILVTWPRWPPRPYMVKTLQKSSSPEPAGRFSRNLVCSNQGLLPIIVIPPHKPFVGGYTVFTSVHPSVRPNESVSETFCFLNILKSPWWNLTKLCKNIHMYKANTTYKKLRARGRYYLGVISLCNS